MPYILESLGSCCSSCSPLAGPGAAFLAQIAQPGTPLAQKAAQSLATGVPMPIFYEPPPQAYASPGIGGGSSKTMIVVGLAAAVGLVAYTLLSKKRHR